MSMQINDELVQALNQSPDGVMQVFSASGEPFWILSERAIELRKQILVGIDQLERDESLSFDVDEIRSEGARRLNGSE